MGRFSDIIPLRRSAILPGGLFYIIGTLRSNFLQHKKHCQTDSAPHFMQLAAILQAL